MDDDLERWHRVLRETEPDTPLHQEMTALLARHSKLSRRLDRIAKISDGFQTQLREAHEDLQRTQERLAEELSEAATYVRNLMPGSIDTPIQIRSLFQPCAELGGDGVGYRLLPDGERVAFYVLDVCGHGLRSALLSIAILGTLNSGAMLEEVAYNPARVLEALNLAYPSSQYGGLFTTMWYGVYDTRSSKLTYACAGHPPALLVTGPRGEHGLQELDGPGTFLGIAREAEFTNMMLRVSEPSTLFVYTDGACEVYQPDGRLLPMGEFAALVKQIADATDPLGAFTAAHAELRGGGALTDDCSMITLALGPALQEKSAEKGPPHGKPGSVRAGQ